MQTRGIPANCEIVIIGGGPAGSIAAGMLAKEGFDVVVLERQQFPRDTVGESLIPQFWRFTDLIDASDDIRKEGFVKKSGGVVTWNGKSRKVSFGSFGFEQSGLHVERDIFDNILLRKTEELGARVFEQVEVLKIEHEEREIVTYRDLVSGLESQVTAEFVVDASGQKALAAKQAKTREFDKDFGFQAFWGYFDRSDYFDKEVTIRDFADRLTHPPLTTVSEIADWGWSWHIVLREKVSVGIVLPKSQLASFKAGGATLEERFENQARQIPVIDELLKPGKLMSGSVKTIRDYAYRSNELVIGNTYLVGDAAAFVDPISSEGVPMAMYAGYLAAWAISFGKRKEDRRSFCRELYTREYGKRLEIFKLLAYPGNELPPELLKAGREIIKSFSSQEIQLIIAQASMTGRKNNLDLILDTSVLKDTHVSEVSLSMSSV